MTGLVTFPIRFLKQVFGKLSKVINYPTVTVEYPYVLKPLVKGARIQIMNNFGECTGCRKCEDVCPIKAIAITGEEYSTLMKRPVNSRGQLFESTVSQFQIDYTKCVFCGLCVNICPAESLKFDRDFTRPHYYTHALKVDLVHIPRSMRRDEI